MGWKAAEKLVRHWKILRGDNVMIIRGKDKGETGLIKRVIHSQNRVIVDGKNLVVVGNWNSLWHSCIYKSIRTDTYTAGPFTEIKNKFHPNLKQFLEKTNIPRNSMLTLLEVKKHIKQGEGHEGGIFTVEAPIHVSNIQVVDPVTGKPCKVGIRYLEDGTKVRVSRGIGASESIIPRPEILKMRTTPRPTAAGPKDTPMDLVLEKTYDAKSGKGMPEL